MIQIQIWGDFECPYSYLQMVALAKLKERYQDGIEIIWRAIELTPTIGTMPPSDSFLKKLQQAAQVILPKLQGNSATANAVQPFIENALSSLSTPNQGQKLAARRAPTTP